MPYPDRPKMDWVINGALKNSLWGLLAVPVFGVPEIFHSGNVGVALHLGVVMGGAIMLLIGGWTFFLRFKHFKAWEAIPTYLTDREREVEEDLYEDLEEPPMPTPVTATPAAPAAPANAPPVQPVANVSLSAEQTAALSRLGLDFPFTMEELDDKHMMMLERVPASKVDQVNADYEVLQAIVEN